MTKRERELMGRIAELERKVRELEARPVTQHHHHYTQPYYIPTYVPAPLPWYPTGYPVWSTGAVGCATTTVASYDPSVPHTLTAN